MSVLSEDFPSGLWAEVSEEAARLGVSESSWLEEAAREKLAATKELARLLERVARGNRDEYLRVLGQVPATPPDTGDEK